jgi:hypothetical protein
MIEFNNLSFGDKVYQVTEDLHVFNRKKIIMVDENGVEWYRYDKPVRVYSVAEYTYVGRADVHTTGNVIPEDIDETKYFIEHPTEGMMYLHDRDADDCDWFSSKKEAEAEMKIRQEEQTELDRR